MYKQKYTPEEKLERIKLFMKYDSSKTLNENVGTKDKSLKEQEVDEDVIGSYERKEIENVKKQNYGVDVKNILSYPACVRFGKPTKSTSGQWSIDGTGKFDGWVFFSNSRAMDPNGNMFNFSCTAENTIDIKGASKPEKTEKTEKTNKSTQNVSIPNELKDINGVKNFQDWLDSKKPGWATGYKDGVLLGGKNGGGYGKFGPRTSKAWSDFGEAYLKEKQQPAQQTPSDVEGGQDEVYGDDPKNILANN